MESLQFFGILYHAWTHSLPLCPTLNIEHLNPTKLYGVNATNTPSKVNTPIGLGTMDVNTNDRGKQTWCCASPCWRFDLSSTPYGSNCLTFIHIINGDVKNILINFESLTCFPSSCFLDTSNIVSFGAIELENSFPQNILVDISIKRWGVFFILHFH